MTFIRLTRPEKKREPEWGPKMRIKEEKASRGISLHKKIKRICAAQVEKGGKFIKRGSHLLQEKETRPLCKERPSLRTWKQRLEGEKGKPTGTHKKGAAGIEPYQKNSKYESNVSRLPQSVCLSGDRRW